MRPLALILRIALGVIFVYAAWIKLNTRWELFALAIDSYQILPMRWVEFVAHTLPWVELAVGLGLIVGLWLRVWATITSVLLAVFFGLMVRAYAKGMEISCGCFGPGEIISWKTLVRDGSLLAGALALTWMSFLSAVDSLRSRRRKTV